MARAVFVTICHHDLPPIFPLGFHLDTRPAAVSLKCFVLTLHILPHRMTVHDLFTKWIVAPEGGGSSWMIKNLTELSESMLSNC